MAMDEFRTNTPSSSPSGMTRPGEAMSAKKPSSGLILTLLILLILLLGALWLSGKSGITSTGSREIAPGQVMQEAKDGEVVAGFPKEFLLEDNVTSQKSYSITYTDGNVSQPVVSYRSAKTLDENIAAYNVFLTSNNWTISHTANMDEAPVTFFYAYKDNAEVNITFASDATGVTVTIAYVLHQQQ